MSNHICDALILTCIDFRFHGQLPAELKKLGIHAYDLKSDAGGVKHLVSGEQPEVADWILENNAIAKRLHGVNRIVLINHWDCGAYGGNGAFQSDDHQTDVHRDELARAKALILAKDPTLAVETYFARLTDGRVSLEAL